MTTIECDDCERTFDIEDEQAGGKVACPKDRKSVVQGKSVDPGGRGIIQKKMH